GPMTKEQKEQLDNLRARRDSFEEEHDSLVELLATEDDPGIRKVMEEDLAHLRKMIDMFDSALGKFGTNSAALS
ncbi:MAG: hypothetical protein RLN72_03450, partial [Henriciella sp.]